MEALVQHAIATVCAVDSATVHPDARLSDLGVDSLAAAEVIVELEIRLDKQLPVALLRELDGVETVSEIAARLDAAFAGLSRG
jgi:acyl carrier protein